MALVYKLSQPKLLIKTQEKDETRDYLNRLHMTEAGTTLRAGRKAIINSKEAKR